MDNPLIVNEFSRKLQEPQWSARHKKWVSQGYEKEIGWRKDDVPSAIRNAINNNEFRINDNYAPAQGKIALIARKISRYSILAVATREIDESDRPTVAYRYFWLENSDKSKIDGIEILLHWWHSKDKPCFELKPGNEIKKSTQERQTTDYYEAIPDKRDDFEKFKQQVEEIKSKIEFTPYIFTLDQSEDKQRLDPLALHYLSLQLKQKYKTAIAWAWNVTLLANPDKFTLIGCVDEKSRESNAKNCKTQSPVSVTETQTSPALGSSNYISPPINIKQVLKDLVENKKPEDDFSQLAQALEQSDSLQWNPGDIFDSTWFQHCTDEEKAKYKALLILLNPNFKTKEFSLDPKIWVNELKATQKSLGSTPQLSVNQYAKTSVDVQRQLVNAYHKNLQSGERLTQKINYIISQLLLQNASIPSHQEEVFYEVVQWLFKDSNSIWKDYLIEYADDLYDRVHKTYKLGQDILTNDQFLQKIINDLKLWEQKQANAQTTVFPKDQSNLTQEYSTESQYAHLAYYQKTAKILESIKSYSLAAFFYQLSQDYVPESVCENSSVIRDSNQIITLKEKKKIEEDEENNSTSPLPFLEKIHWKPISLILLSFILGTGLGLALEFFFKLVSTRAYFPISQMQSIIRETNPVDDLDVYLRLLATGEKRQNLQQKVIENLKNFTENKIFQFNTTDYKEKDKRQQLLKEREQLIKSPLYTFLKQLTPPVKEKLDQTFTTDKTTANPPLSSPEIEQVKEILKSLFYQGDINKTWDKDTLEAIKKFQTLYNIQPELGDLDNETWTVFQPMIQDQQVKKAAESLSEIIQESNNYVQFKAKYEKLKKCKIQTTETYFQCLDKT